MAFLDALLGDVQEAPDSARKLFGFLMNGAQGKGGAMLNGTGAPNSGTAAPQTGSFPIATPPFVARQPQPPVKTGTFPSANAPPAAPPATPAAPAPAPSPMSPTAAPAAAAPAPGPAAMEPVTLGPGAAPAVPNAPLQPVDLGPTPQPSAPARPGPVDLTTGQKWKTAGLGVLSGVDAARKYYDQRNNAPAIAYDEEVERGRKTVANEQTVGKNSAETERDLAQAENQRSEAEARRNPPAKTKPDPKTVDTGEGVFQYNEATGRYDIRVGDSKAKGTEEKFMGLPLKDVQAEISSDPTKYPNGDIYSNRKKAATTLMTAESAAKRDPNEGTWQIQEDSDGKPIEYNTKTGQARAVTGVQRSGTAGKQAAADTKAREPFQSVLDKEVEAKDYASQKTGPGDVGLILAMVEATRPKAGFRMTQTEWNMIQKARSTVGDATALVNKIESGQMLTDKQRGQMLDVIHVAAGMAQKHLDKMNGGAAAAGDKSYTDAEVQAAVAAHPGTTAAQIEQAYKSKGYSKK